MDKKSLKAEEVFVRLVRESRKTVLAIAYARLRNLHDAEDVTQDVFVEAYRNVNKLDGNRNNSAWLFRTTTFRCKDHIRKMARRQRRESVYARSLSDNNSPDEQPEKDRLDALFNAIGQLPEEHRVLVMLKHFTRRSYADISNMTGLSKTTIDGRLRSAKRKLREKLMEMSIGS